MASVSKTAAPNADRFRSPRAATVSAADPITIPIRIDDDTKPGHQVMRPGNSTAHMPI